MQSHAHNSTIICHILEGVKQAKVDSSRKISDFFGQQNTPSPTKTRHSEVQTTLTVTALTQLEGKASNFDRLSTLEQVSHAFQSIRCELCDHFISASL